MAECSVRSCSTSSSAFFAHPAFSPRRFLFSRVSALSLVDRALLDFGEVSASIFASAEASCDSKCSMYLACSIVSDFLSASSSFRSWCDLFEGERIGVESFVLRAISRIPIREGVPRTMTGEQSLLFSLYHDVVGIREAFSSMDESSWKMPAKPGLGDPLFLLAEFWISWRIFSGLWRRTVRASDEHFSFVVGRQSASC